MLIDLCITQLESNKEEEAPTCADKQNVDGFQIYAENQQSY